MLCKCDPEKNVCDSGCAPSTGVSKDYDFNPDPKWVASVARYETVIISIAAKSCAADEDLRKDVMQEARIALLTVRPEVLDEYQLFISGALDPKKWQKRLDSYCGNVIRNSILSYLDSYSKGNWYSGRTRHVRDNVTGRTRKVHLPPRYSSLDELVDVYGAQIGEDGQITWPEHSEDGLPSRQSREP